MFWKVLIALSFVVMSCANAELPAIKASSPVQVSIQQEGISVDGDVSTFIVTATSAIGSDYFQIQVKLPAGVELRSGELSWLGSVSAGEIRQLRFTVSMPSDIQLTIVADAQLSADGNIQFAASTTFQNLSAFSASLKSSEHSGRSQTSIRRGRAITEFPLPK